MTLQEAVAAIDALTGADPEIAHSLSDDIMEQYLISNDADEIAAARQRLIDRCPWWACA